MVSIMAQLDNVWCQQRLSLSTKLRIYTSLVQSVVLYRYGSETWTVTVTWSSHAGTASYPWYQMVWQGTQRSSQWENEREPIKMAHRQNGPNKGRKQPTQTKTAPIEEKTRPKRPQLTSKTARSHVQNGPLRRAWEPTPLFTVEAVSGLYQNVHDMKGRRPLLTDVIHYLVTSVAYRRTHLLCRHCNCQ